MSKIIGIQIRREQECEEKAAERKIHTVAGILKFMCVR